jgi:hypothetical protein
MSIQQRTLESEVMDRPVFLKQVSLRKFRDEVSDIREVVEVSRRDHLGNIQVLGFWTPYVLDVPGAAAVPILEDTPALPGGTTAILDGSYVNATKLPESHPFHVARPFSKTDQAGRKKR